MIDYLLVSLVLLAYFGLSYLTLKFVRNRFRNTGNYWGQIFISFSYAIFFGIGMVASGGEPGFGFPCTIPLAGTLGLVLVIPFEQYLNGVIYPLIFGEA